MNAYFPINHQKPPTYNASTKVDSNDNFKEFSRKYVLLLFRQLPYYQSPNLVTMYSTTCVIMYGKWLLAFGNNQLDLGIKCDNSYF